MKVALVSGIVVEHDAISGSVDWHVRLLRQIPVVTEVSVFAHHIDRPLDAATHAVPTAWHLLRHPEFRAADVAVFHFGIRYGLFDAMTMLPGPGLPRPVVQYHNVTPAHLLPSGETPTIEHSLRQVELIGRAERVWADSPFNRDDLAAVGIAGDHVSVVPIPVCPPQGMARTRDDINRFVYVGRIVESKGIMTLLDAFDRLPDECRAKAELILAGNVSLSDGGYSASVLARCVDRGPGEGRVEIRSGLSDDEIWELYAAADVFVTASLHEGLCLPIVEAASVGCAVVGTACGNLPNLIPPANLVPPHRPGSLSRAMYAALLAARAGAAPRLECVDAHAPGHIREQLAAELNHLAR